MDRDGVPETGTWEQRPDHEESTIERSGKNFPKRENNR